MATNAELEETRLTRMLKRLRERYRGKKATILTSHWKGQRCLIEDVTIIHQKVNFYVKIYRSEKDNEFIKDAHGRTFRQEELDIPRGKTHEVE